MKGNETEYQIQLRNISGFLGREGQPDDLLAGCDTTLIVTRGASLSHALIQVSPYLDCHYELGMAIRSNLVIFQASPAESKLIQSYKDTAKSTHTNVVMEVEKGTFVSIGSGGRVGVRTAVPGYQRNILVSNDANETIYRIANCTCTVIILTDRQPGQIKLLDFTPIVHGDPLMVPTIDKGGDDLCFSINGIEVTITGLADRSLFAWLWSRPKPCKK